MNQTELLQLMIVNAVEKGVAQAIQPLKEELAKIKALNIKILKEQTNLVQIEPAPAGNTGFRPLPKAKYPAAITEAVTVAAEQPPAPNPTMRALLAEASLFNNGEGVLPDVDIPIEMFLKGK